jgi:glycosyltransferase involved in cell wall biosynthesis
MITAVILTLNEENILGKCLRSLDFVDEILVFDSFSTDNTVDIAKSFKARVVQRKFDNYSDQRNAALSSVHQDFKWILMIDADEIIEKDLKNEIIRVTNLENNISLYSVRRKDMFRGKWLKYSSGYPTWFPRLFKNKTVRVHREINEEYITTGNQSRLKNHLIHFPFNKGLNWWISKHNKYSDMEARLMLTEINEKIKISNLFSSSPVMRRQAQKRLSYHIPLRPSFIFIAFFVLKGGFLDGKSGYHFCKLRKIYETMIDLKFKALKSKHES